MVVIKKVSGKKVKDSRGEETISVSIETTEGKFSASSPNGKSTGKHEAKPYKTNLQDEVKRLGTFGEYLSEEEIECFDDLRRIEDTLEGHAGANTFFALESAALKALAKEKGKSVWELINPDLGERNGGNKGEKKVNFPKLVGNCIGGGKHIDIDNFDFNKKPDFQEFHLIPDAGSIMEGFYSNKGYKGNASKILSSIDENFPDKQNSEGAWITSIDDKRALDVLKKIKHNAWDEKKLYLDLGIDVAASSFYKRKKYNYDNPPLKRTTDEQMDYLSNLIENFNVFYIEDPFDQEDFISFSYLLNKFPDRLVVGDDLTTTNYKRVKKAIDNKSINALIVKPNQIGSLLEVKKVCDFSRKNNLKLVFSHRSGETEEDILADLAFGFQADFFKCGIDGKEREAKLKRLVDIEKEFK